MANSKFQARGLRLGALVFLIILSSCRVGRFFYYNFANITDYKIFPSSPVHRDSLNSFRFVDARNNSEREKNIIVTKKDSQRVSLISVLQSSPTVAFLVIRNDSILFENYFKNYKASSEVASFSMSKSYISALIGIAINEGHIKDENDSVVKYLPELTGKYTWDKVTIHHLLQMNSGVKFSESYKSPFSGAAAIYYGTNLREQLKKVKTYREPGQEFEYKSINTQLLGLILERATGKTISQNLEEKIWQPLGMEYDASWSLDKKKNGIEKAFCCINATARDFARFGRLYLNEGKWNGKQIIPLQWVKLSTQINTEPNSAWNYNHQWWQASRNDGDFCAVGYLGQYIYVYPKKNLIIVRLGDGTGKQPWIEIMREIAKSL
ncbi:MAG: serine hydrolase [Bacteroidia bacterium]|nr:serine hydrolase [Bacteroidia bacterium]